MVGTIISRFERYYKLTGGGARENAGDGGEEGERSHARVVAPALRGGVAVLAEEARACHERDHAGPV